MKSPALESLASFPAFALSDLDESWSLTRRFDTKFLIPISAMDQFFRDSTTDFAVLEIEGQRSFSYRTTYFDSPDLLLYRDHAQKRKRRVKVRLRTYVESNRTRLEVKAKRGNGQTHKVIFEDVAQIGAAENQLIDNAISEVYPTARYNSIADTLVESAVTQFDRSTLISRGGSERITCDSFVVLSSNGKSFQLLPELVLVEVKSHERVSETVRQLRQLGFHSTSFSKYGAAIEATHDLRPRIHSATSLGRKLVARL